MLGYVDDISVPYRALELEAGVEAAAGLQVGVAATIVERSGFAERPFGVFGAVFVVLPRLAEVVGGGMGGVEILLAVWSDEDDGSSVHVLWAGSVGVIDRTASVERVLVSAKMEVLER